MEPNSKEADEFARDMELYLRAMLLSRVGNDTVKAVLAVSALSRTIAGLVAILGDRVPIEYLCDVIRRAGASGKEEAGDYIASRLASHALETAKAKPGPGSASDA